MRPIMFLPQEKSVYAQFGADLKKDLLVANFTHDAGEGTRHWIAKIPRDAVTKAYWLKNTFEIQATPQEVDGQTMAHSQMVFELSRPIELIVDQNSLDPNIEDLSAIANATLKDPVRIDSVVSSFEAMYKFAEDPIPFFAKDLWVIKRTIPAVVRVLSTETRLQELINEKNNTPDALSLSTINYPLNPHSLDLNSIFMNALSDSNRMGYSEFYHIFANSCTTRAYSWIDQSRGGAPSDQEFFDYHSQPERLRSLVDEIFITLDRNASMFDHIQNDQLQALIPKLRQLGPGKAVEYLLTQPKLLRLLLTNQVISAIPSTISENIKIRQRD